MFIEEDPIKYKTEFGTDFTNLIKIYEKYIGQPVCSFDKLGLIEEFEKEAKVYFTEIMERFGLNLMQTIDLETADLLHVIQAFLPHEIPENLERQISRYIAQKFTGMPYDEVVRVLRHWKDFLLCGMPLFYELAAIDLLTYRVSRDSFEWLNDIRALANLDSAIKYNEIFLIQILYTLYKYASENIYLDDKIKKVLEFAFKHPSPNGLSINDIMPIYGHGKNTANNIKTIIDEIVVTRGILVNYYKLGFIPTISLQDINGKNCLISDGSTKKINLYLFPEDTDIEFEEYDIYPTHEIWFASMPSRLNKGLLSFTNSKIKELTKVLNENILVREPDVIIKKSNPEKFDPIDAKIISSSQTPKLFWKFKKEIAEELGISVRTLEMRISKLLSKNVLIIYPRFYLRTLPESVSLLLQTDKKTAKLVFSLISTENISTEAWFGNTASMIRTLHHTGESLPYADFVLRELSRAGIHAKYTVSNLRQERYSLILDDIWNASSWNHE